jgi:hypothetical protein
MSFALQQRGPIEEGSERSDSRIGRGPGPHVPSDLIPVLHPKGDHMKLLRSHVSLLTAVLAIVAMIAIGAPSALAQDATPAAGAEPAHPAHIHNGSCSTLADVVYPLNDIVTYNITNSFTFGPAATPVASDMSTPMPSASASETQPVLFSYTHIDANIGDLLTGAFALNVHESAENIQNYIACGNIPACAAAACSAVTGVVVDLVPLNSSGYFGAARIDADPNGGSNVTVFLFHPSMATSS